MTLSLPPPAPRRAGPRMGIRVDLPLNPRVDARPAAAPRSGRHRPATRVAQLTETQQPNGSDTLRLAQLGCNRTRWVRLAGNGPDSLAQDSRRGGHVNNSYHFTPFWLPCSPAISALLAAVPVFLLLILTLSCSILILLV